MAYADPERRRQKQREYRELNREKIRAAGRDSRRRYYAANRDEINAKKREKRRQHDE
ncbi:hypothetical protein [Mycobacterium paraense]|uniref:hypothetical protein n=1 Tax=Mycobacterium paraense TaxID=767916 RepID=UPI0014821AB5|nr:hypothetical protein [Mycobacterium paraense]